MDRVQKLLGSEQASWVFDHNITWEDDVWKADYFDVEQVHRTARKKYLDLLFAITEGNNQIQSRILMFQGQSGAGKTHLIRALRSYSHCADKGYFGYAQMTPDVKNYADYYLRRLINSLEKPYSPIKRSENSLLRLTNSLVSDAEMLSIDDLEKLRETDFSHKDLARLIMELADGIVSSPKFCDQDLDINIIRALLYLQRNDPKIDQRIRQYLYGRQLNELSSESVAALDPNDGEDRAFEIIESLGRLMWTTEQAAMVFCIDQVEDLRFFDDAEERFQKAIRDLIQIANRVPSGIILISCLDDFYFQMREYLPQSFVDRIEKAGPVVLRESRTEQEARLILQRRLKHVISATEEEPADMDVSEFFGESFVHEMAGLSTRRLLEAAELRRRELCGMENASEELAAYLSPTGENIAGDDTAQPQQVQGSNGIHEIQQNWERFTSTFEAEIPSDEDELVSILTSAILLSREEGMEDIRISVEPSWIEGLSAIDLTLEYSDIPTAENRLFICNKGSQGGGLKRQMEKVIQSAGGRDSIILRASDFPPNPRSVTSQMLRRYRQSGGRSFVIPIYEWERMITLQEFRDNFKTLPGFGEWMKAARIIQDLPSIRHLLRLDLRDATRAKAMPAVSSLQHPILQEKLGQVPQQPVANEAGQTSAPAMPPVHQEAPVNPATTPASAMDADNVHRIDFAGTGQEIPPAQSAQDPAAGDSTITFGELTDEFSESVMGTSEPATPPEMTLEAPKEPVVVGPHQLNVGSVLPMMDDQVIFPVNILKRHAAVLGGSGSGKTTLALNIIEQLLERELPVILIDRKGDLCSYANPEVWMEDAGLSEERIQIRNELREKLDVAVYTPGRISGRPISITLMPNGIADLPAHEQQQLANVSAAALSDMLHLGNSATHQRQGGILTVALRLLGAISAREVTLADLIGLLEDDHSEVVDETYRMDPSGKLRRDLVAQLDSLRHRNWALFEGGGEPLTMDSLLGLDQYSQTGKTRLSVIYTGFLGDNENILFWVSQFLSEALRFCQRNPNDELQAVIMFDEADLYIPANSKPATKEPLESLLKRARSAGIGLMLATQSPGDLDYKSRDQITSWFIGKVREDTALRKLKAAFASETGIDPVSALPNQKVGEFHLLQEGAIKSIKADRSLVKAEQVPFDRIEDLAADTALHPTKRKRKNQLLFDFG
ncbi:MAG: helicase HerA-like domain-containing protein [Methyloligellaceae bacterium]